MTVTLEEAKTDLGDLIAKVASGEYVISPITKNLSPSSCRP